MQNIRVFSCARTRTRILITRFLHSVFEYSTGYAITLLVFEYCTRCSGTILVTRELYLSTIFKLSPILDTRLLLGLYLVLEWPTVLGTWGLYLYNSSTILGIYNSLLVYCTGYSCTALSTWVLFSLVFENQNTRTRICYLLKVYFQYSHLKTIIWYYIVCYACLFKLCNLFVYRMLWTVGQCRKRREVLGFLKYPTAIDWFVPPGTGDKRQNQVGNWFVSYGRHEIVVQTELSSES